jgi:hypothetical protein
MVTLGSASRAVWSLLAFAFILRHAFLLPASPPAAPYARHAGIDSLTDGFMPVRCTATAHTAESPVSWRGMPPSGLYGAGACDTFFYDISGEERNRPFLRAAGTPTTTAFWTRNRRAIEAIEPTRLLLARHIRIGSHEERPVFERFGWPKVEQVCLGQLARSAALLNQTPTERYESWCATDRNFATVS